MTVQELKELLEDYGDHLEVVFKWEDYSYADPRQVWFQIDGEPTAGGFKDLLTVDLEKIKRPE